MPSQRSWTVAAVATILMLVVSGCAAADDQPTPASSTTGSGRSASSSTGATPATPLPPAKKLEGIAGARTYAARPNPDWVLVDGGSAWVANVDKGVGRYDAHTGQPLGSAGPGLDICTGMASGFGSVWAVDCPSKRLFRFDLKTGEQVSSVELPFDGIQEEGSLAAGDDGVYVVAAGGTQIARVDPTTGKVASRFPAPQGAAGLRFGFGSLWVTSPSGDSVTRLDPRDGTVQAAIKSGSGAYFLDVGEGAVWVLNNARSEVLRIDPATNAVSETIDVSDVPVDGGDLAVGGGSVWARVSDVLVARIDPSTNRVTDRIGNARGSGSVDADSEAVWISAHDVSAVYRVPL
jgi:streptogramin lyase